MKIFFRDELTQLLVLFCFTKDIIEHMSNSHDKKKINSFLLRIKIGLSFHFIIFFFFLDIADVIKIKQLHLIPKCIVKLYTERRKQKKNKNSKKLGKAFSVFRKIGI